MTPALVALAVLVLAALFAALELGARAFLRARREYFVWAPCSRVRMELDREVLPQLEPVVRFEVNRDGERGDEVPADWSRTARVLVAGGSVAECWFLDQETAWPAVIQRELNRPEARARLGVDRVHVGNIARSLVDCRQIDLMFARVLDRYPRLDVVLLMVGASDVVHWLEKGTPAHLEEAPIRTEDCFEEHPEGPFGWGPRTLALRRIGSRWNKRLRRPVEVRARAGKRLGDARRMRARAEVVLDEVPDPRPMLEHFEKYLRSLVARARERAARVIVVRQPWFEKRYTPEEAERMWNFGQGRPYRGLVTTYYSHRVVWELMRRVDERTRSVAEELGVEALDLMPLLARDLEVYYDELHHTPKGCEAVGRAVAAAILRGAPEPAAPAADPVGARMRT